MKLKVCGMTMIDQLKDLENLGVDYAGLIFYDKSPRFASINGLTPDLLKKENIRIPKIGVFVNESLEKILETIDRWNLQMVQLHGDESPHFCEQVSNHAITIKAFRIGNGDQVAFKTYPYIDAVNYFLFDTKSKLYGGSGEQFDWQILNEQKINKPYFLSGGIGPGDVDKVIEFNNKGNEIFSLDVNSVFETTPGVKNMEKIKSFVGKIKKK